MHSAYRIVDEALSSVTLLLHAYIAFLRYVTAQAAFLWSLHSVYHVSTYVARAALADGHTQSMLTFQKLARSVSLLCSVLTIIISSSRVSSRLGLEGQEELCQIPTPSWVLGTDLLPALWR